MKEAVCRIDVAVKSRGTHQIATANLDFARNALRDQELQRVICDCSMVLPDGVPMLWAADLLGMPLQERVTGVDLIPELARLSAEKGYGIFFLGSSEENSSAAARVLEQRFPGVRIAGRYAPPLTSLQTMCNQEILRQIRLAAPDILLVAFGNPKQEFWIHQFKNVTNVPVQIGVGGSFEMISGSIRRAPTFIQKMHLEWLYRMAQEPMRLLPRYLRDAATLVRHLPLEFAAHRMQSSDGIADKLEVFSSQETREVIPSSRLRGIACEWLNREVRNALMNSQNLTVNMRNVRRVDPDGLGCLMEARRLLHAQGLSVSLSELSPVIRRVIAYSGLTDLFRISEIKQEAALLRQFLFPPSAGGSQLLSDADWTHRHSATAGNR